MSLTIEQLRRPKVLGMAAFDWIATLLVVLLMSCLTHQPLKRVTWITMLTAIAAHKVTGTNTQLNYYLGLNKRVR